MSPNPYESPGSPSEPPRQLSNDNDLQIDRWLAPWVVGGLVLSVLGSAAAAIYLVKQFPILKNAKMGTLGLCIGISIGIVVLCAWLAKSVVRARSQFVLEQDESNWLPR